MQTFETIALVLFLTQYLISAFRSILTPGSYRDEEIAFYKSGTPPAAFVVGLVLGSAAFAVLIVHFALETPSPWQILLYVQVLMFELLVPFHFLPFFRKRTTSVLTQKSAAQYRSSGYKRIAIAVLMVVLPFWPKLLPSGM